LTAFPRHGHPHTRPLHAVETRATQVHSSSDRLTPSPCTPGCVYRREAMGVIVGAELSRGPKNSFLGRYLRLWNKGHSIACSYSFLDHVFSSVAECPEFIEMRLSKHSCAELSFRRFWNHSLSLGRATGIHWASLQSGFWFSWAWSTVDR
jgi:hypothetical protein